MASALSGTIAGQVLDDRGQPLPNVAISAMGASTSFAVSDRAGQFTLRSLSPGPYLVRAHLDGYIAAKQAMVNVRPSGRTRSSFTLRREGLSGAPRITAAGATSIAAAPEGEERGRDESELPWRLRHLKRSVLKDHTSLVEIPADEEWFFTDSLQMLGRAVGSSARIASALFTHSPLQGQVNLLTTGAFNTPGELLELDRTRGVTYFVLGAPVGEHGDWKVRAALNQGDLSSWILTGQYATRHAERHRYQFGMSYGLHRYEGSNPLALAAITETARNVGALHGYDDWKISRHLTVGYGGHYAHYDYLIAPTHFSPRLAVTVSPNERTRLRAVAARRVVAPGAEEFLPPARAQVLPPQRTFSPLSRDGFLAEDLRHYEVGVERVLGDATLGVRAYRQAVDDQAVTLFGVRGDEAMAADIGHYFVASAGDVDVRGWGLSWTHDVAANVRGSVDYSQSRANWTGVRANDRLQLERTFPAAVRDASEQVHDLTTTLETAFPQSATRIYVLYKVNNRYLQAQRTSDRAALDARWDLQISQGLPFMNFTSAEWEMLVGVRNVFRESHAETSIYDELLVARPPKRVVGGITVKF